MEGVVCAAVGILTELLGEGAHEGGAGGVDDFAGGVEGLDHAREGFGSLEEGDGVLGGLAVVALVLAYHGMARTWRSRLKGKHELKVSL